MRNWEKTSPFKTISILQSFGKYQVQFPDDSEDDRSGQEMVKENGTCSTIRRSFCPCQYNVTCDTVLASRVSGCHLNTQTLKNQPSEHPNSLSKEFLKMSISIIIIIFYHININPLHCIRILCLIQIIKYLIMVVNYVYCVSLDAPKF